MTQKEEYSLFYNMSAIHERRKYDTSATQVRNECYTNDLSSTRVPNFDFDNDFKEKKFSHPYISYMADERDYKKRNNSILRTTFSKCLVPMPK